MHRDDHSLHSVLFFYFDWSSEVSAVSPIFFLFCFHSFVRCFSCCCFSVSVFFHSCHIQLPWSLFVDCCLNGSTRRINTQNNERFGNVHLFVNYAFISAWATFMFDAYFDCVLNCVCEVCVFFVIVHFHVTNHSVIQCCC